MGYLNPQPLRVYLYQIRHLAVKEKLLKLRDYFPFPQNEMSRNPTAELLIWVPTVEPSKPANHHKQIEFHIFRKCFAIFGLWPRSSVKWPIKIASISLSVFSFASAISFKLLRQFAAGCDSRILSGKLRTAN